MGRKSGNRPATGFWICLGGSNASSDISNPSPSSEGIRLSLICVYLNHCCFLKIYSLEHTVFILHPL